MIRGMPKKKSHADRTAASLSSNAAAWKKSQAKLPGTRVANGHAIPSRSQTNAPAPRVQHPSLSPADSFTSQAPSAPLDSQPLTHYFEQLRVSAQQHPQNPAHELVAYNAKQQPSAARLNEQYDPDSPWSFRFPSLPANLTDNGFHCRQRAAQFILLYSQWASREQLTRCNRLSLSMGLSLSNGRDVGHASRIGDGTKHGTVGQDADQQASRVSMLDDNESLQSHHNANAASDNDSEYLDFDSCRTAHLGNKKKRKSTRRNSSAPHSTSNADQSVHSDTISIRQDPPSFSAREGDWQRRVLVDKTNTAHHAAQQLPLRPIYKHGDATAPPGSSTGYPHSYMRLPPRQTRSERYKSELRNRLRARLIPILRQRVLDRVKEQDRIKQDQKVQNAHETRVKPEAGSTLGKRTPAKRTSKAGKRAQAIRGGGAPAKPLTIAEIRSRAAAASTPSSSASTVAVKKSPSPPTLKDAASAPPEVTVENHGTNLVSSTAAGRSPRDKPTLLRSGLPAPASTFDFRMTSNVTFRLRELRSQLDAATRDLGSRDLRAITSTSQHTLDLPSSHGPNGATSSVTNQGDGHADHIPPWARRALDYQVRPTEQDSRLGPKLHQVSNPVKDEKPSSRALSTRNGNLTPKQQGKQSSPHASPKTTPTSPSPSTTKVTNGRRNPARNYVEPSHKHGAACKHGQTRGHGRPHGTGSALFTDDDWICVFCEYELYYGETPLMLRACRNRKKLVDKKSQVTSKAKAVLQKKANTKVAGSDCQQDHDHDHGSEYSCMHDHDHECHHDHNSVSGSEYCDQDHHDDHHHHHHYHDGPHHHRQELDRGKHGLDRDRLLPRTRHASGAYDAPRERCDCGNSIHSSDFDNEDK
ncbi:hypothetical protein EX895_006184 [Sporisorium graminicola]|uniref:Uncharacterized protein n=1 Tax=Sporisorium graminicola TaxID=280036 RepID=A0A4U7KLX0_9BASI|nr:hypothetical protein EX895_006184 [Sporisorium graminicola]TKY85104.1 hypothetical protein EX895_006184 [Sporisorium graminicola]